MNKSIIIISGLLLTISLGLILLFYNFPITGQVINEYTYTTAICDENNYCQDYHIQCINDEVVKIDSLPGGVKHNKDWEDPRNKTELCKS